MISVITQFILNFNNVRVINIYFTCSIKVNIFFQNGINIKINIQTYFLNLKHSLVSGAILSD